jgi:hypothetical protein
LSSSEKENDLAEVLVKNEETITELSSEKIEIKEEVVVEEKATPAELEAEEDQAPVAEKKVPGGSYSMTGKMGIQAAQNYRQQQAAIAAEVDTDDTLSKEEKELVIETIVKANGNKLPLVIGIGGNNTADVIDSIKKTNLKNFEAILSVAPYYNKPNQQGYFEHYKAVAQSTKKDIILYFVLIFYVLIFYCLIFYGLIFFFFNFLLFNFLFFNLLLFDFLFFNFLCFDFLFFNFLLLRTPFFSGFTRCSIASIDSCTNSSYIAIQPT